MKTFNLKLGRYFIGVSFGKIGFRLCDACERRDATYRCTRYNYLGYMYCSKCRDYCDVFVGKQLNEIPTNT